MSQDTAGTAPASDVEAEAQQRRRIASLERENSELRRQLRQGRGWLGPAVFLIVVVMALLSVLYVKVRYFRL